MNRVSRFSLALAALLCTLGWAHAQTLAIGTAAPDFRLQDQNGKWHELADYRGKWVALYFYPKDNTPGCTTQACSFRDNIFGFRELDAQILGISVDDVKSHKNFAEKHSLPFPILADPRKQAIRAYDVLSFTGFAKRETFLIDPEGKIAKRYTVNDPKTHSETVLADIKVLKAK